MMPDLLADWMSQTESQKTHDYTNAECGLIKFCLKGEFCIMTSPSLYYIRI